MKYMNSFQVFRLKINLSQFIYNNMNKIYKNNLERKENK